MKVPRCRLLARKHLVWAIWETSQWYLSSVTGEEPKGSDEEVVRNDDDWLSISVMQQRNDHRQNGVNVARITTDGIAKDDRDEMINRTVVSDDEITTFEMAVSND